MNHALNLLQDSSDRRNTFSFAYKGYRGREQTATGYLFDAGDADKIYIMKSSVCVKKHYSIRDIEEQNRLSTQVPVRHDDTIEVDGKKFTAKINGDYSDAGFLVPILT